MNTGLWQEKRMDFRKKSLSSGSCHSSVMLQVSLLHCIREMKFPLKCTFVIAATEQHVEIGQGN